MSEDKTVDIGAFTDLLYSKTFHRLIQDRKSYLQKEVNRFVREQNWMVAFATVAKIDDLDKLIEIMTIRLEELKKEK